MERTAKIGIVLFLLVLTLHVAVAQPVTLAKDTYDIGEPVLIRLDTQTVEQFSIITETDTYRFMGTPERAVMFTPREIGTYSVRATTKDGTYETKFSVIEKVQTNDSAAILDVRDNKGRNIAAALHLEDESGPVDLNGTIPGRRYAARISTPTGPIKEIIFDNLVIEEGKGLGLADAPRASYGKGALKTYSIDPSELNFTNATVTSTAVGNELWKCREWDFDTQRCNGSWKKLKDIVPGQEYSFTLTPEDPGYAETGVATVNSDKPLYHPGETVTLWMVVLDTEGHLVSDVDVDLTIIGPDSTTYRKTTQDSQITEIATGIYETSFRQTGLEGTYELFVQATGTGVESNLTSSFDVRSHYAFDILRDTPVTIDPWIGPFESSITIRSYNHPGYFSLTEILPDNFTITSAPGATVTEGNGTKLLTWTLLRNDSTITYRANAPLVSPDLYSVESEIRYGTTVFREARPWYIAIDPTSFYDPNGNTQQGWSIGTGTSYTEVDDGDREPNTPGTGDYIASVLNSGEVSEFNFPSVTETGIISIDLWVYTGTGSNAQYSYELQQGGTQRCSTSVGTSTTSQWTSCTWSTVSGSLDSLTVQFNAVSRSGGGKPQNAFVYAAYIEVTYDNPPTVILNDPPENEIVEVSTIDFNFTPTDDVDSALANCTLYGNWSGGWQAEGTITNVANGSETNITDSITDGMHEWNILCYDQNNNGAFASSNHTVRVNANVPSITDAQLNTTTINQSEHVLFNASITDAWTIDVALVELLYPNGTVLNHSLSQNGDEWSYTVTDTTQLGTYTIALIWANDTLGQVGQNTTPQLSFEVTASPPAAFDLTSPASGTVSADLTPTLSWQATTESDFDNYTILLDKDISFGSPDFTYYNLNTVTNNTRTVDFALDANSIYYWRVIAYDTFGNSRNSTSGFQYVTDTLGPAVTLNRPADASYVTSTIVTFNITASDTNTIDNCTVYHNASGSWQSGTVNNTPSNGQPTYITDTLIEGHNVWSVSCTDEAGNPTTNFENNNRTVIVDLTGPSITLEYPNNNTFENETNNLIFNASATDALASVQSCELIINGVVEQTNNSVDDGVTFSFLEFVQNGQYNWSVNCTDTNGIESSSFTYNLTVEVLDTEAPLITLNNPDNGEYLNINNISFNYTPEDATGILNCSLYLDGALEQSCGGPTILGESGSVETANFENVTITFTETYSTTPLIFLTPASQNQGTSTDDNSPVPAVRTINRTAAIVALCHDDGTTGCPTGYTNETLHYIVIDQTKCDDYSWLDCGTESSVSTDGSSTTISFSKTFSSTPYVFTTAQTYQQGGEVPAIAWMDTAGTTSATMIGCTHRGTGDVCDSSTPSEDIAWLAIDPSTQQITTAQTGSADISGSTWTPATFSPGFTSPRVLVTQNDDDGGQDPQYAWARSVTGSGMDFRYCEQDGADVCHSHTSEIVRWLSIESGTAEVDDGSSCEVTNFEPNYFNVSLINEGLHEWNVTCYDNSTEENQGWSTTGTFTIDTTDPAAFNLISPLNGTDPEYVIKRNWTILNWTSSSDTNFDNYTMVLDTNSDFSSPEYIFSTDTITNTSINVSLADGIYYWHVIGYDLASNSYTTETWVFHIHAGGPRWTNWSSEPASPATYDPNRQYNFTGELMEFAVDTVLFENNFSGTLQNDSWTSYYTPDNHTHYYNYSITGLAVGTYRWRWWANDTGGQLGNSTVEIFTVQKAQSVVNLTINGTDDIYVIDEDQYVNFTIDIIVPDSGYVELFLDNQQIQTGQATLQNISFFSEPGTYNVTAIYNETANHTEGRETHFLTVNDITGPGVALVSPDDNSTVGTFDIMFQYNVSDASTLLNCTLYINGTLNQTNTSPSVGMNMFETTVEEGDYEWNVTCYDSSENFGASDLYMFRMRETDAVIVNATTDKQQYERGDIATIRTETEDEFGNDVDSSVTTDIIIGNSTTPWWDTSWKRRKPILVNWSSSTNLTDGIIEVNITGLASNIQSCSEIRIVKNESAATTGLPYTIYDGDGSAWCYVGFRGNVTASSTNAVYFHAYYNNSGAGSMSAADTNTTLTFNARSAGTDEGSPTGVSNIIGEDDTTSATISVSGGGGAQESASGRDPINRTFGTVIQEVNVRYRYEAPTVSNGVWQLRYSVDDGNAYTSAFSGATTATKSTSDWEDITSQYSALTWTELNRTRLQGRATKEGGGGGVTLDLFWVEMEVIVRTPSNITESAVGQEELWVDRQTGSTGIDGVWTLGWDTAGRDYGNYSAISEASATNFENGTGSAQFEIVPDTTTPDVTLWLPEDGQESGVGTFDFTYQPYDINLANCTLYFGNGQPWGSNETDTGPTNAANNTFQDIFLGIGVYDWNVLCHDSAGNSAFAQSNFTLNITGPDLYVEDIWFSTVELVEGQTVTIFANITNQGLSDANESFTVRFYNKSGQINGDRTIQELNISQTLTVNVSYVLEAGTNNITVQADTADTINESNEDNNNRSESVLVSLYQIYYGNISAGVQLDASGNSSFYIFDNKSNKQGNVYVADTDAVFSFPDLYALTRATDTSPTGNDLTDADAALGTTDFNDSIKQTWGSGTDTPDRTSSFDIGGSPVNNVPYVNSTNTNSFITGILWDSADDASANDQFDTTDEEDLVFVAKINQSKTGKYGTYDYEIKVPRALKEYKGTDDTVTFYYEIE